jgi:predicted dienelactone hydrolase
VIGLFEWGQTARVLWNLARLYPELNHYAASVQSVPEALRPFASRGPFDTKSETTATFRATFPLRDEASPLLLFSGGGGDDGSCYDLLVHHYASHGFYIVQPVHFDSFQHHIKRTESTFWAHIHTTWNVWGLVLGERDMWRERCEDLSRILDENGDFGGRINTSQIGVCGYSYGAHVACILGGAGMRTRQGMMHARDTRIKAVLSISGEHGALHQPGRVWKTLDVPVMFVTGQHDKSVWDRNSRAKFEPFNRTPGSQKELLNVAGANHFTFSGRLLETAKHPADIKAQTSILEIFLGESTRFLKRNLQGEPV